MTKLWNVILETEIVVIAETAAEAERVAAWCEAHSELGVTAREMSYWPADWEEGCIPYGKGDPANPCRTLKEWIAMGAAPLLSEEGGGDG